MSLQYKSPKLSNAFDVFMLDQKAQGHTPSTLDFYKRRLPAFIGYLEDAGVVRLAEVTPNHIRQYLISMRDRGLSGHTVHGAARSIRAWFQFFSQRGVYRRVTDG